jgi:LysM repeat protein
VKKPVGMKISDDVWEETSTDVKESVAEILDDYQKTKAENTLLQKRVQRLQVAAIVTAIILVGLVILFAVIGNLFVRPYLRVMRAESDVIIKCVYRPSLTYRIQERDTLFGISMFYDVPVEAIALANGITDVNRIEIGHDITIPESPCVDPAVNTRVAGRLLTATISMATEFVESTRTMSAWMTQYSPTNLTATAAQAETAAAQYTPPDLTGTTATPIPNLDPLFLTATDIVGKATQYARESIQQTAAAKIGATTPPFSTPIATTTP